MERLLYSYEAAAEACSLSESVIRAAVRANELPAVIAPGTKSAVRIPHTELVRWLGTAKPYSPKRAPQTA